MEPCRTPYVEIALPRRKARWQHAPPAASGRLVAHGEIESLGIAHIDCDAFYASVEKRDRPELAREPLIVGHAGGRGVVVTACYVARTFGVRSAMPMFQALELCPHGTVIQPDMAKYKRVSEAIRDDLPVGHRHRSSRVSLDEAYLDLTDDYRTEAPPAAEALATIVQADRGRDRHHRLDRPLLQQVPGQARLRAGEAARLLGHRPAPRPRASWRRCRCARSTVSARSRRGAWRRGGLTTIADLQALKEQELVARFGKFGHRLALFAHGDDDRVVTPHRPVKSISAETTFGQDTASGARLREVARGLCDRVAAQLARKGVAGPASS